MLSRVQRGLEQLYRIETALEVDDFVIDDEARRRMGVARAPREQLLVHQDGDELSLGLFVDRAALARLEHEPQRAVDDGRLAELLLVIEGVSHFVCVAFRARAAQSVSALELELQAEVDKYVTCILTGESSTERSSALRRRLFVDFAFEPDLDAGELERYAVANASALRYAASLERRFVARGRIGDMLAELRRFYRLPLEDKLDLIRAA